MGLCLREKGIAKTIYGFDSFEGFDEASFAADLPLGGAQNEDRHGIRAAWLALVTSKVKRFLLTSIRFVPGYFNVIFPRFDPAVRFCFAHLAAAAHRIYPPHQFGLKCSSDSTKLS